MEPITLASGASYFKSPAMATTAAIDALNANKTFYGPTEGTAALRQAVCDKYSRQGQSVQPEQVLITPGSKQALFNLFSVLLRQGDEVVIPTPAWFGFHELMKYSCGTLVPLPTTLHDNYRICPEKLRQSLNGNSRILLLTNPGNPTGRLYSKAELEALLEVTNEFPNLYVISDEIYDHITYSQPFTPILSCVGAKKEKLIIVNGFSKSFAMSGWRIGFILGPDDVIKKCIDFQGNTLSGLPEFVQEAAQSTLEQSDEALEEMLPILAQNRQLMAAALDAMPGVTYYLPEGAYYFFPDFSAYLHKKTPQGEELGTSIKLAEYLQEHYNLAIAPGDKFGSPGHARLSFAIEPEKLQEAMERLTQGLSELV
ncbi:aminotransferase class I/II-fold pyridoxal phosphate-dependent enzyme [Pontibacter cellulosilyticus]|uniref:Aminotransferase n=1 Tax=Pontibacter cellulosilyticus TaxID=1720253 RepID=A0A923N303_9BACT|nr:aminotransferase class I/II-fold pyridoxal phosphate-dependent enzyme [Pontibacter cellulosilyticus]MBC5991498.1 aminotransferase class I/II-fold pyridoxal phosphate-dependent enzyme [Pontibacter cellulosilyticus]